MSSEEPLLGNFVSSQIPIHVDSPFRENLNFMIGFVSCFWHFDALSGLFWREKKSRLGTTTPQRGKRIRIPAFSLLMKPNTHISSLCVRERPSIFGIGLTEIEVFILKSCKPQDDGMTMTVTATARRSRRRRRLRKPKDDGSVYWKAIAKAQKRETIKRRT